MRIRHNPSSAVAWRALSDSSSRAGTGVARLSSGRRINSAADDAAGLSISERMRSQFQSLARAARNAMDGLSLVNTADATLQQVHQLLQRGRELALQAANDVYEPDQRASMQAEVANLLEEVDRVVESAEFNSRKLFNAGGSASALSASLQGLRTSWLAQSEQVISDYFGLTGDGTAITVILGAGRGQGVVNGNPDVDGKLRDISISFDPAALVNARDADRLVARAMTQVVMARNMNYANLSSWFISGASDLIAGGDEMLRQAASSYSAAALVSAANTPWANDTLHQASAYLAVKYLQNLISLSGSAMSDPFLWLQSGGDLGQALSLTVGLDEASFLGDFVTNGEAFLNNLIASGALADPDVGGVNPGDSAAVIPDGGTYKYNPTVSFSTNWQHPTLESEIQLQVGVNAGDVVKIALPAMGRASLDLLGVDVEKKASEAIDKFSKAIQTVTGARTQLGSTANTLEHTIAANTEVELNIRDSFGRISDTDFARELATLTKQQILMQSSSQVLAQSHRLRDHTAWLLSGLKSGPIGGIPLTS